MAVVISHGPEETEELGKRLGQLLAPGDFIALRGELGAGKTRFVNGVARGLGIPPTVPITSPTFTLLNIYEGRLPLYHFDLYRLAGDDDVVDLGFADYFADQGVSLVEWSERLSTELPPERLDITFCYVDENIRRIEISPCGERFRARFGQLVAQ
jgi:tRNA threonylcarbamoyladenosine biosynthesis protein TsaE